MPPAPSSASPQSLLGAAAQVHFTAPQSRKGSVGAPFNGPAATANAPPQKQSSGDSEQLSVPGAASQAAAGKQDYVFCDPVAFRYLEEEPHCKAVSRERVLTGYEVYIVEQWACSRVHPTFVIGTYTGDVAHEIHVNILRVPADESQWSPRLRKYFEHSRQYARPKMTALGTLLVTNLSSFPSALTVVPVPDGDVKKHRLDFIVNEDLKRMGCSGRSALSLTAPPDTSMTKFHQLFRTSDRIPFQEAVRELVRLCQVALIIFDKLRINYMDGLLCDVTEKGLRDWWSDFGDLYKTEPNDGILGPTTVAALLGLLVGARNRLSMWNAPVSKDAFDLPTMEKAIRHFQRQQRFVKPDRTGKLDRTTLDALHAVTAKSSGGDIFAVPRAIKTTVADLSARAVGSSYGSTEVNAVEKPDIERFIEHIHGESLKFLWLGKARKSSTTAPYQPPTPARRNSVGSDDELVASHTASRDTSESPAISQTASSYPNSAYPVHSGSTDATPVSDLRKAVFRSMTGRMKDVAYGISAGADYVRNRGHQRGSAKDLALCQEVEEYGFPPENGAPPMSQLAPLQTELRAFTAPTSPYLRPYGSGGNESPGVSSVRDFAFDRPVVDSPMAMDSSHHERFPVPPHIKTEPPDGPLVPPHIIIDSDVEGEDETAGAAIAPYTSGYPTAKRLLRRRHSVGALRNERHPEFYPRRLSFSLAESVVLSWHLPFASGYPGPVLERTEEVLAPWCTAQLDSLVAADTALEAETRKVTDTVGERANTVEEMNVISAEVVRQKTDDLRELVKEVETFGARMEYELGGLGGRIRDLEEAVSGLGKFVEEVEERADAVEVDKRRVGWWQWLWGRRQHEDEWED